MYSYEHCPISPNIYANHFPWFIWESLIYDPVQKICVMRRLVSDKRENIALQPGGFNDRAGGCFTIVLGKL